MGKTAIALLGIDLGKNSCSLAGQDATGAVVLRRRLTRESLVKFVAGLPACVVAMEACCGAHFLGRLFASQGHTVRLMSPEYVAPYVKAQKTDDRDAEAIAEAATRPTMRLVTLKSEAQLDLQVLHRARQRLVAERTRLTNQLRAALLERGVILPKRRLPLVKRLDELMEGELPISPRGRVGVLQGTRPGSLARTDAASALDGRQNQAAGDQQARQQLPAHAADPWRTSRDGPFRRQANADGGVGAPAADAGAPQRRRGGRRRQAGPHRLGGAAPRSRL